MNLPLHDSACRFSYRAYLLPPEAAQNYILIVAFFDIFEKGKLFFIMSFLFGNVNGRINEAMKPERKEKQEG